MDNPDKEKKMKTLKITQVRSSIGQTARQKQTLAALGLRRIHHSKEVQGTPQVLGMIDKVKHLIVIEEK